MMEEENQGTGLGDVFDILAKAPSERLLSLTLQLGESPEEIIVHALCLLILQRHTQALDKLHFLRENSLAIHLAEKLKTSEKEDFGSHCFHFQAQSGESLSALAKLFKVLSEQRLCDPPLRNLAYERALCCDCFRSNNTDCVKYDEFREEAKAVCGPQLAELMSSANLRVSPDPKRSLEEENTTFKVFASQDESLQCSPSPLQENLSVASFPSHLEISMPPTNLYQEGEVEAQPLKSHETNISDPLASKNVSNTPEIPGSLQVHTEKDSNMDETSTSLNVALKTSTLDDTLTKPSIEPTSFQPSATNVFLPETSPDAHYYENKISDEEEEETFYAFVILHAPEDAEMAESLKAEIESVISFEGATYSEDFAIPGKSTVRCMEDAVNNSAYVFILLTRNFNSKMLEMKTNIALINSINKKHKINTVIPLLPRENCMPKEEIPPVLQTLVPLDVKKKFDAKLKKSLNKTKIERQKRMWKGEQKGKQHQLKLKEKEKMRRYMEQKHLDQDVHAGQEASDGRNLWPRQHSIHIEKASYIMIGNDSKMTLDFGGSTDKDPSQSTEGK